MLHISNFVNITCIMLKTPKKPNDEINSRNKSQKLFKAVKIFLYKVFQSNDTGTFLQEETANLENKVTNSLKKNVKKNAYVRMLESYDVEYIECSVAAQLNCANCANEIRGVKN